MRRSKNLGLTRLRKGKADRDPDELTAILSSRLNYSKGVRDGDRSPIGKADRELDWVNVTVNRALDEGLD